MRFLRFPIAAALVAASLVATADELDDILNAAVESGRVPAVVAMVADADEVLFQHAAGVADLAEGTPVEVDSIFRIASMTKPITSVAAVQLVERDLLRLDAPMSEYLPDFEPPAVILRVDEAGEAVYSSERFTPTTRQLLTHTSGFGYSVWSQRLFATTDFASVTPTYYQQQPLIFEPGTAWAYGTSTDWVGLIVETVSGVSLADYFAANVTGPLRMHDTSYTVPESKRARVVTRHQRGPDGSLSELPNDDLRAASVYGGGGGLKSTASDYVRFMQMFLRQAEGGGVLSRAALERMARNQSGSLRVVEMKTAMPNLSNDFQMHPDVPSAFGLGFEINLEDLPGRRRAGSLAWAGLYNTYFWIDPASGVCAVLLTQLTPFFDDAVIELFADFERATYAAFVP